MWLKSCYYLRNLKNKLSDTYFDICGLSEKNGQRVFCSSTNIHYSFEERNKILEAINNKPSGDLVRYHLSKGRVQKIEEWKSENGSFQSMEQIQQLGIGVKFLSKFYQSILKDEPLSEKKSPKPRSGQFTIPVIPEEFKKSCKSCVALHVGVSSITWARLEVNRTTPCLLTHWQQQDIVEKKMHLHDLVQRCLYLDKLIPEADCYVLENPQVAQPGSPGNAEQVNINTQKSQLIGILSFALCKRVDEINHGVDEKTNANIFYLKRFLASRLFRTLVGTERISTEEVVTELLRIHFNFDDNADGTSYEDGINPYAGEVMVPLDLRDIYKSSQGYQRDFLGYSLLVGLTFVRLCLLKCPKSVSIILKHSKTL